MKITLVLLVAFLGASVFAQGDTKDPKIETGVLKVMNDQVEAWNRGDLDAFMEGYWKSEDLRFVSGNSVTKGWKGALERYKKSYDTREKMGKLLFSEIEVVVLSPEAVYVKGRFTLERKEDKPTGLFTLVFRNIEGNWRIVHDHTSE